MSKREDELFPGGGYTGGTGRDDHGDMDYSVLLKKAQAAGAPAAEVQGLLDKRTQKALDKGYSQYAYDDVYSSARDYIKAGTAAKEPDYGEAPTEYKAAMDKAIQALQGRKPFSYDAETDPSYQQYKDQYTRLGKQAMEDSYGHAALRTGGLGGSAAMAASQQAYNGYMQALADKIPELRQIAYQMYQDEEDRARKDIDLFGSLDQQAWNRWNSDRTFQRGAFESDRGFQADREDVAWEKAYKERGYRDERGDIDYERAEAKRAQEKQDALALAELIAQGGDYSGYGSVYEQMTPEQRAMLEAMYAEDKAKERTLFDLDVAEKQASIAATNRSNRGGSGGGPSRTDEKPTLTYDQMRKAIEDGNITDNVRYAYEYYLGVPLEEETKTDSWGKKLGDTLRGLAASVVDGSYKQKSGAGEKGTGISDGTFTGLRRAISDALKDGDEGKALGFAQDHWDKLSTSQQDLLKDFFKGRGYELGT